MATPTQNQIRNISELMRLTKLDPEPFINIPETLSLIPGMSRNHLAQLRFDGQGPRFYKPTSKTVYYKASEVLEWIANGSHAKNGIRNTDEVAA